MLYVVEAGQQLHFRRLQSLLSVLGHGPLAESIEHVGFGKIRGLSTRQGTATFLSDILDEAIVKMREQQNQSINTKSFDETTTGLATNTTFHAWFFSVKYDMEGESSNGEQEKGCRSPSQTSTWFSGIQIQKVYFQDTVKKRSK